MRHLRFTPCCVAAQFVIALLLCRFPAVDDCIGDEPLFPGAVVGEVQTPSDAISDFVLLGTESVSAPLGAGTIQLIDGTAEEPQHFLVTGQQVGMKIEQPVFVTPSTRLSWSWKKESGRVCIVQIQLTNPETGQRRYLGYGAGAWSEPTSHDPTVEFFVAADLPRQWTSVERKVYEDMHTLLGWDSGQITEFYASPWEGSTARFRGATITGVASQDLQAIKRHRQLSLASQVGTGNYQPLRLKDYDERHVAIFDSSLEECAPGRNSGANEWSTFGVIGNLDFNAIGREMHVRYPAFDLVFRHDDGQQEIKPDSLSSFRLGLVDGRLPAIWGGWQCDGLLYKVSVMTVPSPAARELRLVQTAGSEPDWDASCGPFDGDPGRSARHAFGGGCGQGPWRCTVLDC